MEVSNNMKYTKEHEWCLINNDIATIGITDFAQSELGDIVFIEFPELNSIILKDASIGTIEAVKTVADIFAPLSGKVIEINTELDSEPNLINESPYESGWIFKIKISNINEVELLLNSDKYNELIK